MSKKDDFSEATEETCLNDVEGNRRILAYCCLGKGEQKGKVRIMDEQRVEKDEKNRKGELLRVHRTNSNHHPISPHKAWICSNCRYYNYNETFCLACDFIDKKFVPLEYKQFAEPKRAQQAKKKMPKKNDLPEPTGEPCLNDWKALAKECIECICTCNHDVATSTSTSNVER
jgi:hypothetical protein